MKLYQPNPGMVDAHIGSSALLGNIVDTEVTYATGAIYTVGVVYAVCSLCIGIMIILYHDLIAAE